MKKIRLSTVSQVYEAFLHSRKALGAKEVTLRTYRTSFLAVCKYADISELPMEELSHLDCYDLHPGVTDDEMLGRIYVEAMEMLDVPDRRKIPEADIIMETRKGVALSYAPAQIAI